jgi:hypothetical protein
MPCRSRFDQRRKRIMRKPETRRSVLHGVCYAFSRAIVAAVPLGVFTCRARPQSANDAWSDKMTRRRAEYQDTPNGIYSCATCTLFVPPSACKVVEGEVSPDGWCKAFAVAD